MSIEYQNVHEILKKRKIKYPQFGFLENSGSVIKIMQWQPKGVLSFSSQRGFWCNAYAGSSYLYKLVLVFRASNELLTQLQRYL